ncbi:hypothetical protein EV421DRAFT_1816490 [Armillaria borealis]|uniref:Uncharacterized protein n=1 Tax=Armillaria borealis TaxID=47425 RepID=A0AA39JE33_9AGAR|nr:hypothetical protein EV421DRAFT_1816490 [Armillaria borealis]
MAYQRLQPSILLLRAAIPHVIWGQDAGEFYFDGPFEVYDELDLQILLPPSKIQEAANLLAPSYIAMTCKEIDDDRMTVPKGYSREDYTIAFRDRPNDFTRLKLSAQPDTDSDDDSDTNSDDDSDTYSDPAYVLLISNTVFDYPLHDVVQVPLPHCPELPFPSAPAIIRLMPVHIRKWMSAGYSRQSLSFIVACKAILESAIHFHFGEELDEHYDDCDQLPTSLKEMISSLNERERLYVYGHFLIGEAGGSSGDSDSDVDSLDGQLGTQDGEPGTQLRRARL